MGGLALAVGGDCAEAQCDEAQPEPHGEPRTRERVRHLGGASGRAARPGAEGRSYGFGVKFAPERIFPFLDAHKVARHNPVVRTGDLYLFSASRVHEVFNVFGKNARIVANSFLAWDEASDEVCMYQ